jgi:hypothetical protein
VVKRALSRVNALFIIYHSHAPDGRGHWGNMPRPEQLQLTPTLTADYESCRGSACRYYPGTAKETARRYEWVILNGQERGMISGYHPTVRASAALASGNAPHYTLQLLETKPAPSRGLIEGQLHARVGRRFRTLPGEHRQLRAVDHVESIPKGWSGLSG